MPFTADRTGQVSEFAASPTCMSVFFACERVRATEPLVFKDGLPIVALLDAARLRWCLASPTAPQRARSITTVCEIVLFCCGSRSLVLDGRECPLPSYPLFEWYHFTEFWLFF